MKAYIQIKNRVEGSNNKEIIREKQKRKYHLDPQMSLFSTNSWKYKKDCLLKFIKANFPKKDSNYVVFASSQKHSLYQNLGKNTDFYFPIINKNVNNNYKIKNFPSSSVSKILKGSKLSQDNSTCNCDITQLNYIDPSLLYRCYPRSLKTIVQGQNFNH